jgi:hypothetical protein
LRILPHRREQGSVMTGPRARPFPKTGGRRY